MWLRADSEGLRTRAADDVSSSPKAGKLETPEEPMLCPRVKAGKERRSAPAVRWEDFLLTQLLLSY